MRPDVALLLAPIAGLAADTVVHVACCHATRGRQRVAVPCAFLTGFAVAAVVTLYALRAMNANAWDLGAYAALNGITYAALGFGYFAFVNLNISSLRLRILKEILDAEGEVLPWERILEFYNAKDVVEARVERLLAGGHFARCHDRLVTGRRTVLFIARVNAIVKRIVLGSKDPVGSTGQRTS